MEENKLIPENDQQELCPTPTYPMPIIEGA